VAPPKRSRSIESQFLSPLRPALRAFRMTDETTPPLEPVEPAWQHDWSVDDQNLLVARPAQRLAWLEEALHLAYATGALKPRKFLTQEEWDAMGSSSE
jgi:hypothetical protein